jgi:hypothetical protein
VSGKAAPKPDCGSTAFRNAMLQPRADFGKQGVVAIRQLLTISELAPEQRQALYLAYDEVIASLGLARVPRFIAQAVARKIIAIGQGGERDPARLAARARRELGLDRPQPKRCP